jgi:hypothetical protein
MDRGFTELRLARRLHFLLRDPLMVLRIERVSDEAQTVLLLSGRIESEQVQELKAHIDGNTQRIAFDLEEVRLVDLDAVHFLAVCEAHGVELRHCPPFVQKWILAEKRMIGELE